MTGRELYEELGKMTPEQRERQVLRYPQEGEGSRFQIVDTICPLEAAEIDLRDSKGKRLRIDGLFVG